jgi:hypothetical protein
MSDRPDGWTKAMWESPFMEALKAEAEILQEGGQILTVNGASMGQATWNLICSKRDLSLWTGRRIKAHRRWKVSDVKWYFGITGTGENLMRNFMVIFDAILPAED